MPNLSKRMADAARMIADHDKNSLNFYTFHQRMALLTESGDYMTGLADLNDPGQVGDVICALDNARIPFEFRPEVSAKLWRLEHRMKRQWGPGKSIVALNTPTVDDHVRDLVLRIMEDGVTSENRTGIRSRAINSQSYTVDISAGQIPSISTKFNWNFGVKVELLWMLSGITNIRFLKDHKVGFWDSWVKAGTAEYRHLTPQEMLFAFADAGCLGPFIRHLVASASKPKLYQALLDLVDDERATNNKWLLPLVGAVVDTIPDDSPMIDVFYSYAHAADIETQYMTAGELPKIYQHQWRHWEQMKVVKDDGVEFPQYRVAGWETVDELRSGGVLMRREIDQIQKIVDTLKTNPDDRGIILTAWNVAELEEMALRPCHTFCQFFSKPMSVRERLVWLGMYKPAGFEHLSEGMLELAAKHDDRRHETQYQNDATLRDLLEAAKVPTRKLSSHLYMRSNDVPLGHPFNVVQYAMLTHMLAQVTGHATDTFTWTGGDCHIYENQWPAVLKWLDQEPVRDSHPTIRLNPNVDNIFDFKIEDIEIVGYKHAGRVEFPKAAV